MTTTKSGEGYQVSQKEVDDSFVDDLATLRTAFNTAMTKLNSDGGVTDTDYAACAALATEKGD